MNRQILDVVKVVSYEMDVSKNVIFEAIEAALEMATKKRYLADVDVKVIIDHDTGDYETFRCWTVFDESNLEEEFDADRHITLAQAKSRDENLQLGDVVKEHMSSIDFGRIAAQTAKQVIVQKVREARRAKVIDAYRDKVGQLVSGIVRKSSRESIILDLGNNAEAIIPKEEMLPTESVRVNDRLRAYLYDIKSEMKGPQLFASRTRKEMLIELFQIEVPEVNEEIIDIKALARDPGLRAKVAVSTNDGRIDPIGACVGMRGSRVQVISNELGGERLDIILWDDNPAQLVINAMAPAEVASIVIDEETHAMDIAVENDQLSQAIGRNGQNVWLASELTGWTLNVMSLEDAENKTQVEAEKTKLLFMDKLDVDEDVALILVREGFVSLEEIVYVPLSEIVGIEEFDEELIEALRDRAKMVLKNEENAKIQPAEDLLSMQGMNNDLAYELASRGIVSMEDLAEQSVDDLLEIKGFTKDKAASLIMTAREPWFE